jgi:hypothetical protein
MVIPALLAIANASEEAEVLDITIGIPIRAHLRTMSEVRRPVV